MTATSGELEKLRIEAFDTPDCRGSAIGVFESYVNPSEITLAYEMEYDAAQGAGTTGSRMNFKKVKPGDLALSFFLDGTGVNPPKPGAPASVQEMVQSFQMVTGYNGSIHRPNYLLVAWGTLTVKRCVLKSASIAYKLFRPDGVPLRAVITANFTDQSDDNTRVALAGDESPDLTHLRLIKAGDSLPVLCQQIYGDAQMAPLVARANGLAQMRAVAAGTRLYFPPLRK